MKISGSSKIGTDFKIKMLNQPNFLEKIGFTGKNSNENCSMHRINDDEAQAQQKTSKV